MRYHFGATTSETGLWVVGLPLCLIAIVWVWMIPIELVEDLEYERAFKRVIQGDGR